ncbi:MAG: glycosyltransferase family 39 protein [Gaiellaceae bacterium MAG52_C11]|nr:glycosyltransferase family 39 protein [Candidatus Gaiellasilicea maunaloa]
MVDSLRRVPTWAWLAGIVAGSIVFRAWLGSRMPAPFIFTDELQYQENARSLAAGEGIEVRDEPYGIVSVLYPLLLAPAYLLFDSLTDAYAAARTINAVVMSLAAIPAFLLARRVLPAGLSLAAALLAVALPSLAYTGTLMSENAFYPAFLLAAWALVRALEAPSFARQAVLLAVCAAAVLVRVQGLALVLAALTAPLLLRAVARRPLRPFVALYAVVAGGALLVLVAQLVRGASLQSLLGAYAVVGEEGYDLVEVVQFLFWHIAELDLYVGVFPVAAFVLLAGRVRSLDPRAQELVAATVALVTWTLLVVAAFASRFAGAIEERNMFVVAPLLLIALLVWVDRGASRPAVPALVAALVAAVLPALIPYERFLQLKVRSDTLMIVPLWNVQDSVTLPRLDDVVLVAGLAAGALFLLVPCRFALVLPAAVLAYFALAIQPIHAGPHGMERAAADALFEGIRVPMRDWIDRAVPDGAEVAALWTGRTNRFTVLQNEFFSRSVGRVYTLGGPMPGGFPETLVTADRSTGEVRREDGMVARAEYAYTDGSVALDGEPVARDAGRGLTLYRTSGPLISTTTVTGVYNDQWSGPEVRYRRVRCEGGTLTVLLDSDPGLLDEPQRVTATSGGNNAVVRLDPTESAQLRVPLDSEDGICRVRFTVSPTKVPRGGDTRELGVHFRAFEYTGP